VNAPRRWAVISGAGAVSALGKGLSALHAGLIAGAGGATALSSPTPDLAVAAQVPVVFANATWLRAVCGPNLRLPADGGVFRDRKVAFAVAAAFEAWRSARCDDRELDAWLVMGLGLEHVALEERNRVAAELLPGHTDAVSQSPARLHTLVDLAAVTVRECLGLRGFTVLRSGAGVSGADAVAHAAALVERGQTDLVICGGADAMLHPTGLATAARLGGFSPAATRSACRPFDRRRDGRVLGEGAAMFVVELEQRALARGAVPLARVSGSAASLAIDAAALVPRALAHAGRSLAEVGLVVTHGEGSPAGDRVEANGILRVLGGAAAKVPMTSYKGAIGHTMGAAGALEVAAALDVFAHDRIAPIENLGEPESELGLDLIQHVPRHARVDVIAILARGIGSRSTALVLERADS
jgi:3-oxoacyl-(acyl-carrier-protein) synthase